MRKHIVKLPDKVRLELEELVRAGTHPVRVVRRANILLKTQEGLIDEEIAEHVGCTARCVAEIRKRFCQGGLERALWDAPRRGGTAEVYPQAATAGGGFGLHGPAGGPEALDAGSAM